MGVRSRVVPAGVFAALVIVAFGWSSAAAAFVPLPDGANDFNSPGFLVRHAWVKFALVATRPIRGELSRSQEDQKVARFFALNRLIAQQERIAGDPQSAPDVAADARAASAAMRDERSELKNTVAEILDGRLTRVIKEAGLTRHIGGDIVWPPVNVEFQNPPAVLVKSPRAVIRKDSETLLQGDLPIARVQQIESAAEADGQTSALVVTIGGIAMYPAIIPFDADYHYILQDIAHEWMHHYLYFAPLGRAYFESAELTTLNETVANMVGRELGDMLFAEYPLEQAPSYVTIAGTGNGNREAGSGTLGSPLGRGQRHGTRRAGTGTERCRGSTSRCRCATCGGRWRRCWRRGRSRRRSRRWSRSGSSWRRTGTTSGG